VKIKAPYFISTELQKNLIKSKPGLSCKGLIIRTWLGQKRFISPSSSNNYLKNNEYAIQANVKNDFDY